VYYCVLADAARSVYRVGALPEAAEGSRKSPALTRENRAVASRGGGCGSIFVKVICSIQTKRYTPRKEYRFKQSSA
jgi:hypothetical protein